MKLTIPKEFPLKAIVPAVFAGTGLLCFLLSIWTASAIERFSKLGVRRALAEAGHSWARVEADGLQVIVSGTAPTEAMRFRALSVAGNVVDAARLRDGMSVADAASFAAPDFSMEILRNDDGISLIGLAPTSMDRAQLLADLTAMAAETPVTDMLESAEHEAPQGWATAAGFAIAALKSLPRSKVSVTANHVSITAISDSAAQKATLEADLKRKAPKGLRLTLDISAPRPVITPFTLRFLADSSGARFDACSADSDRTRSVILAAAVAAGASADSACTVGLGVPTPAWVDAVVMGLQAIKEIGHGSITFSDADIALIADADVAQATFDSVVGELESNLPEVFSLSATLSPKTDGDAAVAGATEFTATLSPDGRVDLRGRLADTLTRNAVESFAKARFGTDAVHGATRLDASLPEGWPARVLVGLEALGELQSGTVIVAPDRIKIDGVTGSQETSAIVARILSSRLGEGGQYDLAIKYDPKLDVVLDLPTAQECAAEINSALAEQKISFEPGAAIIAPEATPTIEKIAASMKKCSDYPMEVGGHTDSQGREEMNLALSDQRARAVIVALQSHRVLTGNLVAKGYGETVPIEANNTEIGRETNRRIEFRLLDAPDAAEATATADGDAPAPGAVVVQTPDEKTIRPKLRPGGTTNDN